MHRHKESIMIFFPPSVPNACSLRRAASLGLVLGRNYFHIAALVKGEVAVDT